MAAESEYKMHILDKHRPTLILNIYCGATFLNGCVQRQIIHGEGIDRIRKTENMHEKARLFFDLLKKRSADPDTSRDYKNVVQLLQDTNQHHVAYLMDPAIKDQEELRRNRMMEQMEVDEQADPSTGDLSNDQLRLLEQLLSGEELFNARYDCIARSQVRQINISKDDIANNLQIPTEFVDSCNLLVPEIKQQIKAEATDVQRNYILLSFIKLQSRATLHLFLRELVKLNYPHVAQMFLEDNTPRLLKLYDYQLDLASTALDGQKKNNYIICAPTGSGKTLVAAYICHELMMRHQTEDTRFKALFLVCTRPLIKQQRDAFRQIFTKEERMKVKAIGKKDSLKSRLVGCSVVTLTAQIFLNALNEKKKGNPDGLDISDLDLLIFDECHHTEITHPFNQIMQIYMEKKYNADGSQLPQILGLTASVGVREDRTALDHAIKICANLDCSGIRALDETKHQNFYIQNPRPTKDQIMLTNPRSDQDEFIVSLIHLMKKIERINGAPESVHNHQMKEYETWANDNMFKAEKEHSQKNRLKFYHLVKLKRALDLYDELEALDVIEFLREELEYPEDLLEEHRIIKDGVEDFLQRMEIQAQNLPINPKIEQLISILKKQERKSSDSKGIILTSTREVTYRLCSYIETHPDLRWFKPGKLVGKRGDYMTMTDMDQNNVVEQFRKDNAHPEHLNLLVATDVAQEGLDIPKCNFVIRYNFVGNEIGSIQARGRARAPNSECFLIVTKGSVEEEQEYKNMSKEHDMIQAMKEIAEGIADFPKQVEEKQVVMWRLYQLMKRQEEERRQGDGRNVSILCRACSHFLCLGSDMVSKGNVYICANKEFLNRVEVYFKDYPHVKKRRTDKTVGGTLCGNSTCREKIGPINKYSNDSIREYGYLVNIKNIKFLKQGAADAYLRKQWKAVDFNIQEETLN